MSATPRSRDEGGFALAMVVLLLFAIAVAGATGFQVVSNEFTLATQNRDSQEALVVARGGLQRFLGETVGVVGDEVSYAIGNGIATVTTRKVLEKDSLNHLYFIKSEGSVADARTPTLPATRTVGAYAWHRLNPIPLKGALWVSGGTTDIGTFFGYIWADVQGSDHATTLDCPGGGTAGTAGVVKGSGTVGTSSPGTVTGSPATSSYSTYSAMYDTTGIRWDILKSSSFPVDFDGAPPDWDDLDEDSFPIVRYQGDLSATSTWSGRGVLIVTGTLTPSWGFSWDGIVLAGAMAANAWYYPPVIEGMLIAGLNGANSSMTLQSGIYYYHSCNAYAANKSLSYLEVLDNTLFEVNG
jgi:hypothetical protein